MQTQPDYTQSQPDQIDQFIEHALQNLPPSIVAHKLGGYIRETNRQWPAENIASSLQMFFRITDDGGHRQLDEPSHPACY